LITPLGSGPSLTTAPDDEAEAVAELSRRAARIRGSVALGCATVGILAGMVGFLLLRGFLLDWLGGHIPILSGAIGFGGPLLLMFLVGRVLGRALVRARLDGWIGELATHRRVPRERLEEFATLWR
jgi:hypothetical protein